MVNVANLSVKISTATVGMMSMRRQNLKVHGIAMIARVYWQKEKKLQIMEKECERFDKIKEKK